MKIDFRKLILLIHATKDLKEPMIDSWVMLLESKTDEECIRRSNEMIREGKARIEDNRVI